MRFERVGVFRYSDEEQTSALDLADKVPAKLARARQRELLRVQKEIMRQGLSSLVGQTVQVLVDSGESGLALGRIWSQAPEVDGQTVLRGSARRGELVRARVTRVKGGVDLEAEVLT
jgi:ribosomal protein S12 methylthiotransferase